VLLRHEISSAVEVLALSGPVTAGDAGALGTALQRALELSPRGVLVDLTDAGPLSPEAFAVLAEARRSAPGWPRPSLVVCGLAPEDAQQLDAPMHSGRTDALAHVDDRSDAPRRRFGLGHEVVSPCAARQAVGAAADELQLGALTDDLKLVVSELVTNAVRYAQPPVEVEIEADDETVTISVADGSPGRPGAKHPDDDAEGGRGLLLIDLLAAETGVRPQPPGKAIWATLRRTAPDT